MNRARRPHSSLALLLFFFSATAAFPAAPTPIDEEAPWPRVRSTNGYTVTIFQPQVERWTKNWFIARAAVELQQGKTNLVGVVWFEANGNVDRAKRLVTLDSLQITKGRFPEAPDKGSNALEVLRQVVPSGARTVSLDYLITALGFSQAAARQGPRGLKHTPPEIVWATNRTVLILIDGEPKLKPVPGGGLRRVVNTPALLVSDATGRFYLAGEGLWYAASGIGGPWSLVQTPPPEIAALSPATASAATTDEPAPRVVVRTHPAELLETRGLPDFRSIRGTALQYAADTDSQLFFHTGERMAYLLVSGRWYKASSLNGPWSHVAPHDLPEDFGKIPPGTPQAVVLGSVPDTPQSELAVLANSVPATATVNRQQASIELSYDGEPKFKPIEGTSMSYAVNAQLPVILAVDTYYAVDDAVWFTAKAATGPWQVAEEVPEQIYTIPPESPVYYATFARVYESTNNEVEVGYTPGYTGSYEDEGTVVYGTGWDYDPWYGDEYYGWGWTWGYGYIYSPWYQWWVWRNWWAQPYALRYAVADNIYDRWQAGNGVTPHDIPKDVSNRLSGLRGEGFPALYGRFRGSTRAAAMAPPPNTLAVNPYSRPKGYTAPRQTPHGAQLLSALQNSPGGGRDLYASPDGQVYMRKNDGWYGRQAGGTWNRIAPLQGSVEANRQLSAAGAGNRTMTAGQAGPRGLGDRVPNRGGEARAQDIANLEREAYARSLAQMRAQNWRANRNVSRPVRSGGRRR